MLTGAGGRRRERSASSLRRGQWHTTTTPWWSTPTPLSRPKSWRPVVNLDVARWVSLLNKPGGDCVAVQGLGPCPYECRTHGGLPGPAKIRLRGAIIDPEGYESAGPLGWTTRKRILVPCPKPGAGNPLVRPSGCPPSSRPEAQSDRR